MIRRGRFEYQIKEKSKWMTIISYSFRYFIFIQSLSTEWLALLKYDIYTIIKSFINRKVMNHDRRCFNYVSCQRIILLGWSYTLQFILHISNYHYYYEWKKMKLIKIDCHFMWNKFYRSLTVDIKIRKENKVAMENLRFGINLHFSKLKAKRK